MPPKVQTCQHFLHLVVNAVDIYVNNDILGENNASITELFKNAFSRPHGGTLSVLSGRSITSK